MLTQLTINDFAIVQSLDIELQPGMTTITGETGAGKSIAIDALSLCLGGRGEAGMVRTDANRADICGQFNIATNKAAAKFLSQHDLDKDNQCIVRRTISKEGRSKGYINGIAVPISHLKELGLLLLNIHGQHAHQGLLDPVIQLKLLDQYASHKKLLEQVERSYFSYQLVNKELSQLKQQQHEYSAKVQLLEYQVEEFDQFALIEGEFEQIEAQHTRLANSDSIKTQCYQLLEQLSDSADSNIEGMLNQASSSISDLVEHDQALVGISEMINAALIQIQESSNELNQYSEQLEQDPQQLAELELRLSKAMQLARKHQIQPQQIPALHQQIKDELARLSGNEARIEKLADQLIEIKAQYVIAADFLSASRSKYAQKLNKLIMKSMRRLSMEHGIFEIALNAKPTEQISLLGQDAIEFKVTTNPGQPLEPLHKVVSGGELSRISLAISVITADKVATPTLIFDEVDVGISGPTAATVGAMLRELGKSTQIICVTHLPQVAACGHQQLQVAKHTDGKTTSTTMLALSEETRVLELARLLGGNSISHTAVANAQELLISH
ncbi:MAG: DNA repair protein RecN [Gammaproteobacteria bacterium]|nr:DNA repair protein RecN [Gammaproteobacteria bacterium]